MSMKAANYVSRDQKVGNSISFPDQVVFEDLFSLHVRGKIAADTT